MSQPRTTLSVNAIKILKNHYGFDEKSIDNYESNFENIQIERENLKTVLLIQAQRNINKRILKIKKSLLTKSEIDKKIAFIETSENEKIDELLLKLDIKATKTQNSKSIFNFARRKPSLVSHDACSVYKNAASLLILELTSDEKESYLEALKLKAHNNEKFEAKIPLYESHMNKGKWWHRLFRVKNYAVNHPIKFAAIATATTAIALTGLSGTGGVGGIAAAGFATGTLSSVANFVGLAMTKISASVGLSSASLLGVLAFFGISGAGVLNYFKSKGKGISDPLYDDGTEANNKDIQFLKEVYKDNYAVVVPSHREEITAENEEVGVNVDITPPRSELKSRNSIEEQTPKARGTLTSALSLHWMFKKKEQQPGDVVNELTSTEESTLASKSKKGHKGPSNQT